MLLLLSFETTSFRVISHHFEIDCERKSEENRYSHNFKSSQDLNRCEDADDDDDDDDCDTWTGERPALHIRIKIECFAVD